METLLRDSSAVEQEAVNFKVLGSNPSRGAEFLKLFQGPTYLPAGRGSNPSRGAQ